MYDAKTGNFSGFVVDLVSELAKEMHFKFEIKEVSDGGYGGLQSYVIRITILFLLLPLYSL